MIIDFHIIHKFLKCKFKKFKNSYVFSEILANDYLVINSLKKNIELKQCSSELNVVDVKNECLEAPTWWFVEPERKKSKTNMVIADEKEVEEEDR